MSNLTKSDIDKMIELLQEHKAKERELSLTPLMPFGIPIIENPHLQDLEPVIKLSDTVNVSVEFRNKCNKFYIDLFGYREPMMLKTQYGIFVAPNMASIFAGNCTA